MKDIKHMRSSVTTIPKSLAASFVFALQSFVAILVSGQAPTSALQLHAPTVVKPAAYRYVKRLDVVPAARDISLASPFMVPGVLKFANCLGGSNLPQAIYSYKDTLGQWHTRIVLIVAQVTPAGTRFRDSVELLDIPDFVLQDVGDIDNDGLIDIFGQDMIPVAGADCYVKRIYEQPAAGALPTSLIHSTPAAIRTCGILGYVPSACYAPDLDGNGFGEILWDRQTTTVGKQGRITRCTGNDAFIAGQSFSGFTNVNDYFVGDPDGDGAGEFARFNTSNQWNAIGFNGGFYQQESLTSTTYGRIKTAAILPDLTTNGFNEVATLGFDASPGIAPKIYFYETNVPNPATYTQLSAKTISLPLSDAAKRDTDTQRLIPALAHSAGTFTIKPDLAINSGANVYIYSYQGTAASGAFTLEWDAASHGIASQGGPTAVTDLDGNGFPELWFNTSYTSSGGLGSLSMFENVR